MTNNINYVTQYTDRKLNIVMNITTNEIMFKFQWKIITIRVEQRLKIKFIKVKHFENIPLFNPLDSSNRFYFFMEISFYLIFYYNYRHTLQIYRILMKRYRYDRNVCRFAWPDNRFRAGKCLTPLILPSSLPPPLLYPGCLIVALSLCTFGRYVRNGKQ